MFVGSYTKKHIAIYLIGCKYVTDDCWPKAYEGCFHRLPVVSDCSPQTGRVSGSSMAVSRVPSPPPQEVNTPVAENWCYTQVRHGLLCILRRSRQVVGKGSERQIRCSTPSLPSTQRGYQSMLVNTSPISNFRFVHVQEVGIFIYVSYFCVVK